jgi:peptidoglycan/xylan/chitin deacetylase (PgdA/CDA1 family)
MDLYRATRNAYFTARAATRQLLHPRSNWSGLRILAYHRVCEERDPLGVTPARLREQLLTLLERDVQIVPLDEGIDRLESETAGRFASITFDDGYADNLELALPVLTDLGVSATIFVVTEIVNQKRGFDWYEQPPRALDWDGVRRLQDAGIEIGAHGTTHTWLTTLGSTDAWDEIHGSREELERQLGSQVRFFCYPAGRCTDREVELVRRAGYSASVTTAAGLNHTDQPRFLLHRDVIGPDVNWVRFAAMADGVLDGEDPMLRAFHRYAWRSSSVPIETPMSRGD